MAKSCHRNYHPGTHGGSRCCRELRSGGEISARKGTSGVCCSASHSGTYSSQAYPGPSLLHFLPSLGPATAPGIGSPHLPPPTSHHQAPQSQRQGWLGAVGCLNTPSYDNSSLFPTCFNLLNELRTQDGMTCISSLRHSLNNSNKGDNKS